MGKLMLIGTLLLSTIAAPGYHVLSKIPIGGEGRWDYATIDAKARRLYVANSTRVVVVDIDTKKVVGEIKDTPGVHGIALAPELNRGFISNGKDDSVTIFDLKILAKTGAVPTGENPDAIIYEPVTSRVFVFNGKSHSATVIDARIGIAISTVPLNGKPEFAVADGTGKVFVNIENRNEIDEYDAKKLRLSRIFFTVPGTEPTGLAMDRKQRRLFAVCHNKLMVVLDANTGIHLAALLIGENPDAVVFDPDSGTVFSSNGDGTLTLVREVNGHYQTAGNVPTERGARTVALDPVSHCLFLPTADFPATFAVDAKQPQGRPVPLDGTFHVLVVGK